MKRTFPVTLIVVVLMCLYMTACRHPYDPDRKPADSTNVIPTITESDLTGKDDAAEPSTTQKEEETAEATYPVETESSSSEEATDLVTEPGTEPATEQSSEPEKPTQPSDHESTSPQPTDPKPTDPPAPTNPPHTHNYKATVVAPTCTNKGYTEYKCSCGASYKDNYKNALGHNYKVTGNGTATCTSGGYVEKKCTRCGDTQRTQTAALGHDYQETGFTQATCTAPFTVNYKCSRCGATTQETSGEPLGHSWVHHDAETHWRYGYQCYCGAIFWTYEEWSDHFDSFSYAEKEIRDLHAGYRNYDEKIVDKPAYSQCSRCGLIQNY